jgi:hypothetical protein
MDRPQVPIISKDILRDTLVSPGTDNFSRVVTTMSADTAIQYYRKIMKDVNRRNQKKKAIKNVT